MQLFMSRLRSTFQAGVFLYCWRSIQWRRVPNPLLSRSLSTLDSNAMEDYPIYIPIPNCPIIPIIFCDSLFIQAVGLMSISDTLQYLATIGTLYPSLSFVFTIAATSWLGNAIMTQYLMQKQIRHTLSRIIFLITFSCSLSLLSMYLFEIMRFKINHSYWYFVLTVLIAMCEIVIPLCLIFRLPFVDHRFTSWKIPILGVLLSVAYLFFFYKKVNNTWEQLGTKQLELKIFIELIIEYGVYLMALMSAYGAIWFPYVLYNLINQKERFKILHAKKKMEDEIHFIIEQIKKHKYEMLQIKEEREKVKAEIQNNIGNVSTVSRLLSFVKGGLGKGDEREKHLGKLEKDYGEHTKELQTLKKVHEESFLHYRDILEQERRHTVSQSFNGKLFHKFSYVLAAYSISRIILTVLNTIRGRKNSADPITRLVNIVQDDLHLNLGPTFQQITQYISFILMGYIMITSVRAFSMNFKAFIDYILRRKRLNMLDSATQIYLFSLIYGIYFLAAVILQQSGLPRAYVTTFEHITGKINLIKHFVLFDWLFLGMCLFSLVLVFFTERQRGGKLNFIIRERNIIDLTSE